MEQKIGQLLQLRVDGDYKTVDDADYRFIRNEIEHYHVGSVQLSARMRGPNLVKGTPVEVARVLNRLQRYSKLPLLVAGDFERGLASRLSRVPEFPFPMAFGAINNPQLVEEFAAISAQQARALGIHWAYAPTADVNTDPENPIINTRSFGEDPKVVSALVAAYIRGAHRNGLLVTAKHFPGQGDTSSDSHISVVQIDVDRRHLERYEFPPFKRAIAEGTDAIMLAHAAVPALDPEPRRIATISPHIIEQVLRVDFGFQGVVVTDALEMGGLASLYRGEPNPTGHAAVDAIKAGADVLMLMGDVGPAFTALLTAVRKGEISETRIDASVRRILEMKAAVGLDESRFVDINAVAALFGKPDGYRLAQSISDESITLVRNNGRILPLASEAKAHARSSGAASDIGEKRLVVVSSTDSLYSPLGREFENQLRRHRPKATFFHVFNDGLRSDSPLEILSAIKAADEIVIAAFVTHTPGRQLLVRDATRTAVGLQGTTAQLLENAISANPSKTVVIALGSPYLIRDFPKIETYLCTYSLSPTAEITAVKALFGEIENRAKLPVTLPGVAVRGFSLPWPTTREEKK